MPALPSVADLLLAGWQHNRGMFTSPRTGQLLSESGARTAEQWHRAIEAKVKKQFPEIPANHYK